MKSTIVFQKNWEAVHAKNADGSRKYKYIINTGSSRSSKTFSILQLIYLYAYQNERKRITSWRETKKICKDTVLHDFRQALPLFENWQNVTFNKTESIHTFPSGSTYEIYGGDDEVTIHGLEQHVAHLNEPYNISKETFDQLDMRTSDFILIDWNPRQGHWIDELSKHERAIVIHSTFRDNPFVPTEQRAKILSYKTVSFSDAVTSGLIKQNEAKTYDCNNNPIQLPEKLLKDLIRCQYNEKLKTASEWSWQVYGLGLKAEKPNKIYNWNECTVEQYNNIQATEYIGIDWGKVDPFGIVAVKYHDGRLFLNELNYDSEDVIREKITDGERMKIMISDSSEHGIVNYVFDKLKIDKTMLLICDTNRPEKGAFLRQKGYNVIPAPNKAILEGISILQSLEVYYTNTSNNIKLEVDNYEWDSDRAGLLEQPIDAYNHLLDPTRYVAMYMRLNGIIKYL